MKNGYKQTEVGVIPEDWEVKPLDIISILISSGKSKTNSYFSGEFPIYGSTGIIGFSFKFDYQGDKILVARVGANAGTVNHVKDKYCVSDNTLMIQLKSELDFAFILYFLKYSNLNKLVFGSGQPLITGSQLKQLPIPIPPTKAEQAAIATALSDVDALISALDNLIAKKRLIKQGAMQELFSMVNHKLLIVNDEYITVKLGDIADIKRGASPRPIDSPIWFDENSDIGWLRISDISKSKKYLTNTTQKLSQLGIRNSRFVENGNLIMSICATVGKPIILNVDVCIHDGFVVFSNLKIDKEYLYYILEFIQDKWANNGQTSSQMNLNTNLINNLQLTINNSPLKQTAIAQILSDMDNDILALETQRNKTLAIKQGMMQELLTGKIRLI